MKLRLCDAGVTVADALGEHDWCVFCFVILPHHGGCGAVCRPHARDFVVELFQSHGIVLAG